MRFFSTQADVTLHGLSRCLSFFNAGVQARKPVCIVLFACSMSAFAAESDVRFAIRSFVVDGALQVPAARLQTAVQPFIGPAETFDAIQRAVVVVQQLYLESGYSAAQVTIPQQDITTGVVHLKVVEPRIGKVSVIGNQYFDVANIRASMPALREGQTPDIRAISSAIRLSNESYAKQTQISFRQSDASESATQFSDSIDAVVRVADVNPARHIVSFDNTGTAQTGQYRIGYAFQHANLFNLDHILTAQYVTSPDHLKDVKILGANYRIPFYSVGGALDLSASYSNVRSGNVTTAAGSYAISGSGDVFGIKYTHLLPRIGDWDQRVAVGLDYRYFQNNVNFAGSGASLIPNLVTRPVTLSYAGVSRTDTREWRANVGLS